MMTASRNRENSQTSLYKALLKEIRALRREVQLFLPRETWEEYSEPEKIKQAYFKALKQYPKET